MDHSTKEEVKIILVLLIEEDEEVTISNAGRIIIATIVESLSTKLQRENSNTSLTLRKFKMLVRILIATKVYFLTLIHFLWMKGIILCFR